MKKILSVLLALVMIVGMIPMSILTASAADTEVVFNLGANGDASHNDGNSQATYSDTVDGYTLNITNGTNMYTGARDAKGNSCIKLGTSKKTGGLTITVPDDVDSVEIAVAKYKAKTSKVSINGTTTTLTKSSDNGQYDVITVDTADTKTVNVATVSGGVRAMVNSITFIVTSSGEGESEGTTAPVCEHANQTTTTVNATCGVAGSTTVTCDDCGETISTTEIPAISHNYVDGICANCQGTIEILSGKFYIASKRSTGNFFYMTSDLGTASTKRFTAVDSGADTLPENITNPVEGYVFELVFDASGAYKIKAGENYVGWSSGNSGALVAENAAKLLTFAAVEGQDYYHISFDNNGEKRNLTLNNAAGNNYFAFYTSEQANNLYLIPVVAGGEVEPEDPDTTCEHANQTTTTVNATCGVAGSTTVTCDDCSEIISTTEIPATGEHSYANGVCSVCGAINSTLTITEATAIGAAMTQNTFTTGQHYVTGVVESIVNTQYGNLYIQDEAGNKLYIYGVYSADGSTRYDAMEVKPAVGDTVTLYGVIGNYNGAQMKNSWLTAHIPASVCAHEDTGATEAVAATCTEVGYTAGVYCNDCESYISGHEVIPATGHIWVDGACDECGEAQTSEATISFASTEQRVSQDGSTQVWSNAGLTVTNNKANSTNPIIDSSNPVRFYKGSEIVIVFPGMTKIEVTCDTAAYATALKDSINDDNATVSVNDTVVTIVLSEAANSYSVQLTAGQVRVDAITVVAGTCAHVWGELVQTVAPTCTTTGTNTSTCALCGETKEETIAATGHTYNFADDSVSCDVCDFTANKTNIGDLPYANSNNLYYIEGTVTYVNGRNVYMEDATGGICVYYAANEQKDVAQGDVLRVVDSLTLYNDLLETTETLNAETQKVSSGNALPNKTITVAELLADASADKNYLGTRITLNQVTLGEIKTDGNTTITDDNGNSTIIRYMPAIEGIAAGDVVNVTAVVSIYKGTYQLLINKSTAAQDVVKCVVAPSIELTHVSLDPAKDALGFKAAISGDLPAGAQVGIKLSVEGGLEKTYLVDIAELKTTGVFTLRLNGIMAANGGEKKITGTPVIMIGEEAITGTPNTTSMKQTIIDVNAAWDTFKATQQAAVKELYNDYAVIMAAWLGADNKIVPPVAEAPAA